MRQIPENLVAEVRLSALGLALYRLHKGSISVQEACQLTAAGWTELELLRVPDLDGQQFIFECAALTPEGRVQLEEMENAYQQLEADWGERRHIWGFIHALARENRPPPRLTVQKPRVFGSQRIRSLTRDLVADHASQTAKGWCLKAPSHTGIESVDLPTNEERRQEWLRSHTPSDKPRPLKDDP